MFEIGDSIVYPMYGAGVVENIEKKTMSDVEEDYYVMNMPIGNLTIMIAVDKAEEVGIRLVKTPEEVDEIMEEVSNEVAEMPENWNQRFNEHTEMIKTGELEKICAVYRNLKQRDIDKGLSTAEKKMKSNVIEIAISELTLSKDISDEEAAEFFDENVNPLAND